jgi:hypothetical protein
MEAEQTYQAERLLRIAAMRQALLFLVGLPMSLVAVPLALADHWAFWLALPIAPACSFVLLTGLYMPKAIREVK